MKVITVGGAGGQIDPTQVQVADLSKQYKILLAAKVRQKLRKEYNFPKQAKRKFQVDCVFSTEQLRYPTAAGDVCHTKASADGQMTMDCAQGFGSVTSVTGTFGTFCRSTRSTKNSAGDLSRS